MVMIILFRFMKAFFLLGARPSRPLKRVHHAHFPKYRLPIICDRVSMAKLSWVSSGDEVSTESGSDRVSSLLSRAVEGLEPGRYRSRY
jgi:hypothetical protein